MNKLRIRHPYFVMVKEQLDITGTELAEKLGINQGHYSKLETLKRVPKESTITQICENLNVLGFPLTKKLLYSEAFKEYIKYKNIFPQKKSKTKFCSNLN